MLLMLEKAYINVKQLTSADVDDKTLIDVLQPAVKAYQQVLNKQGFFITCLNEMSKASNLGWLSTKDLIATLGRGAV